MHQVQIFKFEATSPAAAGTTVATGQHIKGLSTWRNFVVDANIIGGAAGTMDIILQRRVGVVSDDVWADWIRFPQVAATITESYSVAVSSTSGAIFEVEQGTGAAPGTAVLAANTLVGGHPGNEVRAIFVVGVGETTGAIQTIYIQASR